MLFNRKTVTLFRQYSFDGKWFSTLFDTRQQAVAHINRQMAGVAAGRPIAYAIEADVKKHRHEPMAISIIRTSKHPKKGLTPRSRFTLFRKYVGSMSTLWVRDDFPTMEALNAVLDQSKKAGTITAYAIEEDLALGCNIPLQKSVILIGDERGVIPYRTPTQAAFGYTPKPKRDLTKFEPEATIDFEATDAEVKVPPQEYEPVTVQGGAEALNEDPWIDSRWGLPPYYGRY